MAIDAAHNDLAIQLRDLHRPGRPLVLTNVYDAPTATLIADHPATKAIATASYAIAATKGIADNSLTLSQNLSTVRSIAESLMINGIPRLPLTVDVQDGYEDVAQTIGEIIKLGAVGCNLEDFDSVRDTMRPLPDAVKRIELALQTARDLGVPDFALNARTDILGYGGSIENAVERGKAFLKAGACTVFVWGPGGRGVSKEEVEKLVVALEGRVNVKMGLQEGFLTVPELKEIGVARISLGPELYRAAMRGFKEAADAVLDSYR